MRYFISYAPRFGSYAAPVRSLVEQSPYYWWWYALTRNTDYLAYCQSRTVLLTEQTTERERKSSGLPKTREELYADWGDVHFNGDRFLAFCKWWRQKVSPEEEKGAYLFAEPLRDIWTTVVSTEKLAAHVLADDRQILIALPIHQQRRHAQKSLNRIVSKCIPEQKGRNASDPRNSKARYHLSTAAQVKSLKLAFDIYDMRHGLSLDGIPTRIPKSLPHNVRIAKAVGLEYKPSARERADKAAEHRALSTTVSRYLRAAQDSIANAGLGTFP